MRLNKPKFWGTKNSFISFLLFPISLMILLYIFIKKKNCYNCKIQYSNNLCWKYLYWRNW